MIKLIKHRSLSLVHPVLLVAVSYQVAHQKMSERLVPTRIVRIISWVCNGIFHGWHHPNPTDIVIMRVGNSGSTWISVPFSGTKPPAIVTQVAKAWRIIVPDGILRYRPARLERPVPSPWPRIVSWKVKGGGYRIRVAATAARLPVRVVLFPMMCVWVNVPTKVVSAMTRQNHRRNRTDAVFVKAIPVAILALHPSLLHIIRKSRTNNSHSHSHSHIHSNRNSHSHSNSNSNSNITNTNTPVRINHQYNSTTVPVSYMYRFSSSLTTMLWGFICMYNYWYTVQ